MATVQKTLLLLMPEVLAGNHTEAVLKRVAAEGFEVAGRRVLHLSAEQAQEFFADQQPRSSYPDLLRTATAGPIVALVLLRENAVAALRTLLGPADASQARADLPQSLRALYSKGSGAGSALLCSETPALARRDILWLFKNSRPDLCDSGETAYEYLGRTVNPLITQALAELCKVRPPHPVKWLSLWLDEHDPAKAEALAAAARKFQTDKEIIYVLGGPGSGKGTQCAKLAEEFGFGHFSAGDILRDEAKKDTEEGRHIAQLLAEGQLVSQETIVSLLGAAIVKCDKQTILVDGFPRALDQMDLFHGLVKECTNALFFECSEETMLNRIIKRGESSGRSDDNLAAAKKRFKTFQDQSMPVIEKLRPTGKVLTIKAEDAIDQVYAYVRQVFVQ